MNTSPDMVAASMKMVAALGTVLAVILALLYGLRRMSGRRLGSTRKKSIQVLENHYLGLKKSISLVRVPGKVLVIGITGDRINLLDRLDEEMVDRAILSDASAPFGSLLSRQLKKPGKGFGEKETR
ncbi:MAG: flagellar biosynthetic protein FliO [Proteobacteria bacterium]|nr:MAG: flagellar biosynthetic protein FliO [Pseudomonadota bacterium]PIE67132.1 MAG: flagellar biosynthetic protein FliO [Deltaproteobacteria bacterium]